MNSSKLLIEEKPLHVLPSLAKLIGLNEAIILQKIQFWLKGSSGIEKDGERWIYNTYQDWLIQFPFWSETTIKRIFSNLKRKGLIKTKKLSKDKWDKTNYYTIDYVKLNEMIDQNDPIDKVIGGDSNDPIDKVKMTQSISTSCTNEKNIESLKNTKDLKNNINNENTIINIADDTASDDEREDKVIVSSLYRKIKEMGIKRGSGWFGKERKIASTLLEKYSPDEIQAVVDWAFNDDFYRGSFNSLAMVENVMQKMKGGIRGGRTNFNEGHSKVDVTRPTRQRGDTRQYTDEYYESGNKFQQNRERFANILG